jgi:hypothetical protein
MAWRPKKEESGSSRGIKFSDHYGGEFSATVPSTQNSEERFQFSLQVTAECLLAEVNNSNRVPETNHVT